MRIYSSCDGMVEMHKKWNDQYLLSKVNVKLEMQLRNFIV